MATHKLEIFDGDKRIDEQNERFIRLTIFFLKYLFLPLVAFVVVGILTNSPVPSVIVAIVVEILILFRKKIFSKKKNLLKKSLIIKTIVILVIILGVFFVVNRFGKITTLDYDLEEGLAINEEYESICIEDCISIGATGLDLSLEGRGYKYSDSRDIPRLTCACNNGKYYSHSLE